MAQRTMTLTRDSDGQVVNLTIMPRFNIDSRASFGEGGVREQAPLTITLAGRVEPATGETTAMPAWLRLWDFHETASDVRVATYLDGVLEREYAPSDFRSGPKITGLSTPDEDGQFGATTGFLMELTAQRELTPSTEGGGAEGADAAQIAEVHRDYINRRLARISWVMEATGEGAPSRLRAAEPNLPGLRRSEIRSLGQDRFQIVYEWEAWQKEGQYLTWTEEVQITRPGLAKGYVPGEGPDQPPVSWDGQTHAGKAIVVGELVGTDRATLIEPEKLFNPDRFIPLESVEPRDVIPLIDKHGFYALRYTHVFQILSDDDLSPALLRPQPDPIPEVFDVPDSEVSGF